MDIGFSPSYYTAMTHASAVQIVVRLVPEIEKRGASEVLTEYAVREDLPPTQLEKLAQVYNTLKTVSHIDKAEDRGSSVELLDVPTLVVGYATGLNQEKEAQIVFAEPTHDVKRVNLNLMMRKAAGLTKEAAQVVVAPDDIHKAAEYVLTKSDVADALLQLEVDLEEEMSKLAGLIYAAAPRVGDNNFVRDISEVEEEALQYASESSVKAAGDFVVKYASAHRTRLERFEYTTPVIPYAYATEHVGGKRLAELAELTATLDVVTKLAGKNMDADYSAEDFAGFSDAADRIIAHEREAKREKENAVSPEELDAVDKKLAEAEDLISRSKQAPGEKEQESKPETETSGGGKDRSSGSGSGRDKDSSKQTNAGPGAKGVIDTLTYPFRAAGSTIEAASAKADAMLHNITGKERQNTAQKNVDVSVADIRRAMAVRRLIGTDPVLREAEPKAVLDVYNSIAARNPKLAGDMSALRLILREAVSYEGLTLDSQKLLTDIYRTGEQADESASNNDKRRYSV